MMKTQRKPNILVLKNGSSPTKTTKKSWFLCLYFPSFKGCCDAPNGQKMHFAPAAGSYFRLENMCTKLCINIGCIFILQNCYKIRNRLKITMEKNRKLIASRFCFRTSWWIGSGGICDYKKYILFPNSHETVLKLLKMRQLFFLIPFRGKLETVDSCWKKRKTFSGVLFF